MPSNIELEEVEAIKAMIERSLPPAVHSALQQAGISLTLGSSQHAEFQPVVVDPGFVEELAERELVEEMVSYRKDVTGIDHTIFISPKGYVRHAARMKVAINPPDSIDPRSETTSIAISDGTVVVGATIKPELLDQVRRFIALNREALLDYWEYRIDTEQLRQRLKPI